MIEKGTIMESEAEDYSDFVRRAWEYCYDTFQPKPVDTPYSISDVGIQKSFSFGDMHEHTSSCFVNALAFQSKHCLIIWFNFQESQIA